VSKQIITPRLLEADATVPQCLDDQFVTDATLRFMTNSGLDYHAEEVIARRRAETRTELVRSLIYSSQVVVNRAYLVNNPFLYETFDEDSSNERRAFARLLQFDDGQLQAVVPFLFDEKDLGPLVDPHRADEVKFEIQPEGRAALKALLDTVGSDVRCVKLDSDPARNAAQIAKLDGFFKKYFLGSLPLILDEPAMINVMASELVGPELSWTDDGWKLFVAQLEAVHEHAIGHRRELSRTLLYRDFLAAGDTEAERKRNVAAGRFLPLAKEAPFRFVVKKLADLRYNTALPDFVDRYAFTPAMMPSRIALQDFEPSRNELASQVDAHITLVENFAAAKRLWRARASEAMDLPLLSSLSMQDVTEVRSLPEWRLFADAQNDVLRSDSPQYMLDRIAPFEARFDAFQRTMSAWYHRKYEEKLRPYHAERVASYVTFGIQVAGHALLLGLQPTVGIVAIAGSAALAASLTTLPQRIKGYTVSLYVTMFKDGALDRERSYSIDLMHSNMELTRADVLAFAQRVGALGGDQVDLTGVMEIADQGTDEPVQ
jgi:hypothetical protein